MCGRMWLLLTRFVIGCGVFSQMPVPTMIPLTIMIVPVLSLDFTFRADTTPGATSDGTSRSSDTSLDQSAESTSGGNLSQFGSFTRSSAGKTSSLAPLRGQKSLSDRQSATSNIRSEVSTRPDGSEEGPGGDRVSDGRLVFEPEVSSRLDSDSGGTVSDSDSSTATAGPRGQKTADLVPAPSAGSAFLQSDGCCGAGDVVEKSAGKTSLAILGRPRGPKTESADPVPKAVDPFPADNCGGKNGKLYDAYRCPDGQWFDASCAVFRQTDASRCTVEACCRSFREYVGWSDCTDGNLKGSLNKCYAGHTIYDGALDECRPSEAVWHWRRSCTAQTCCRKVTGTTKIFCLWVIFQESPGHESPGHEFPGHEFRPGSP